MNLVEVQHITKQVRLVDHTLLTILHDVSLCINSGDHLAIVGRSGSGKTTLLNILGLLDSPSSGSMSFAGREITKLSNAALGKIRGASIGYVFQQFNLLPGLTTLENVMMPLSYASGKQFWQRRQIASELLARVGLSHRLNSHPDSLSGGEQQRVAIARALARTPQLILADEPTGALDLETGATVMELLAEITAENAAALITITHDPKVAALAQQSLQLENGVLCPAPSLSPTA